MKRLVAPILAVIVLVAGAVAVLDYVSDDAGTAELVMSDIEGEVHVVSETGESVTVGQGMLLDPHVRISTGGASRVVLSIDQSSRIRLGPYSSVNYKSRDDQAITLELEGGAIQATVRPGARALRVGNAGRDLLTTDGSFGMGLAEDGTLVVEMSEGSAVTSGFEGVSQVTAGDRVTVTGTGTASVMPIPSELLLHVTTPPVAIRTNKKSTIVRGQSVPGALITVFGGEPPKQVPTDSEGNFEAEVFLLEGDHTLTVEAVDPLGRTRHDEGYSVYADWHGVGAIKAQDVPR
jgi:hypothetical protein